MDAQSGKPNKTPRLRKAETEARRAFLAAETPKRFMRDIRATAKSDRELKAVSAPHDECG